MLIPITLRYGKKSTQLSCQRLTLLILPLAALPAWEGWIAEMVFWIVEFVVEEAGAPVAVAAGAGAAAVAVLPVETLWVVVVGAAPSSELAGFAGVEAAEG